MNSPSPKIVLAILSAFGAVETTEAQISNPGFELGSAPTTGTFAGGNSRVINSPTAANLLPTNWTFSGANGNQGNGRADQWVYDAAGGPASEAHAGQAYMYLSTTGSYVDVDDDCIQGQLTGLNLNQSYAVSYFAADAGSYSRSGGLTTTGTGTLNDVTYNVEPGALANSRSRVDGHIVFELGTGGLNTINNGVTPIAGVWGFTQMLPSNTAWSDTVKSDIPWQKVNFTFTATASTMDFWLSGNEITRTNNVRTSVVLDGLTISAIPEPSTCGLLGLGTLIGLAMSRRRHRN